MTEHGVAHTPLVLEPNCPFSHWRITRLSPNFAKRCWAIQANTWTLCNTKVIIGKHGTPTPIYNGLKKEYRSTDNVEYKF